MGPACDVRLATEWHWPWCPRGPCVEACARAATVGWKRAQQSLADTAVDGAPPRLIGSCSCTLVRYGALCGQRSGVLADVTVQPLTPVCARHPGTGQRNGWVGCECRKHSVPGPSYRPSLMEPEGMIGTFDSSVWPLLWAASKEEMRVEKHGVKQNFMTWDKRVPSWNTMCV